MNITHLRYLLLLLVISPIIIYGIYRKTKLNNSVFYTIATYGGSTIGGRQGGADYYFFSYGGRQYSDGIKIIRSKINMYYYCKVSKSNPNIFEILYQIDVPYCLSPKDVPKKGWKNLPRIKCKNDNTPPLFAPQIITNSKPNT